MKDLMCLTKIFFGLLSFVSFFFSFEYYPLAQATGCEVVSYKMKNREDGNTEVFFVDNYLKGGLEDDLVITVEFDGLVDIKMILIDYGMGKDYKLSYNYTPIDAWRITDYETGKWEGGYSYLKDWNPNVTLVGNVFEFDLHQATINKQGTYKFIVKNIDSSGENPTYKELCKLELEPVINSAKDVIWGSCSSLLGAYQTPVGGRVSCEWNGTRWQQFGGSAENFCGDQPINNICDPKLSYPGYDEISTFVKEWSFPSQSTVEDIFIDEYKRICVSCNYTPNLIPSDRLADPICNCPDPNNQICENILQENLCIYKKGYLGFEQECYIGKYECNQETNLSCRRIEDEDYEIDRKKGKCRLVSNISCVNLPPDHCEKIVCDSKTECIQELAPFCEAGKCKIKNSNQGTITPEISPVIPAPPSRFIEKCDGNLSCANCVARQQDGVVFGSYQEAAALEYVYNQKVDKWKQEGGSYVDTPKTTEDGEDGFVYTGYIYTSLGCIDTTDNGLITRVVQIALGIIGGVILVRFLQAGMKLQGGGSPEDQAEAVEIITSAIVALLLFVMSMIVLRFIGFDVFQIFSPGTFQMS